jgi:uncharacterized repeat protein (TIGR01451 family)
MLLEIEMRVTKMWFATLLPAVLLVAGCGGGEDQTTGSANNRLSAAAAPTVGTEQSFAVLGGQTVTNTGPSEITGNMGVSPGSAITGFPPGLVIGETHAADAVALQAQSDTTTAYLDLAGQPCTSDVTGQDLGGKTLVPGVYCSTSGLQLTGALMLDAEGVPGAVWVFKAVSTLTTASSSSVVLANGADPCNVFWQIGSSATVGTNTSFVGNIYALTSIALQTNATLSGRALARNGAVTLDSNTINAPVCGASSGTSVTLGKAFSPATISAGGDSKLTITFGNANDTPASFTARFIDTLPSGLMVVPGTLVTNCTETLTAGISLLSGWFIEGPSKVGLEAEGEIPANASCTLTAKVTASAAGTFVNSLPAGALQTSNGTNADPAAATLTVN